MLDGLAMTGDRSRGRLSHPHCLRRGGITICVRWRGEREGQAEGEAERQHGGVGVGEEGWMH